MNEIVKKINNTFDYQIKRNSNSLIDKQIFNKSLNFNLKDWNSIRDESYWKERDLIEIDSDKKPFEKDFDKKLLLLKHIYDYLKIDNE